MTNHDIDISKARKAAKALARKSGITHQQALDSLARDAGYATWGAWLNADESVAVNTIPAVVAASALMRLGWFVVQEPEGWYVSQDLKKDCLNGMLSDEVPIAPDILAIVEEQLSNHAIRSFAERRPELVEVPRYRKSETDVFLALEMQGYHFEATLSADGPYIQCYDTHGGWGRTHAEGYVALGYCLELHYVTEETIAHHPHAYGRKRGDAGPWICKYDTGQPRISLARLNCAEVAALQDMFGIAGGMASRDDRRFMESPALEHLVAWAERHPRKAAQWAKAGSYVGDCHTEVKHIITERRAKAA